MSWSRCSSLLLALFLVTVTAGPAAAVTVSETTTHERVQAGERLTAEFTLEELYQNPQTGEWTLNGTTELEDATWTVTFLDQQGTQVDTRDLGDQNITVDGITPDNVAEVQVQVTGTVPEPDSFSYPENETFLLAGLEQVRSGGTLNGIASYETIHYTEESQQARQAIGAAEATIAEAETEGVDVTTATENLESAKQLYRSASTGEDLDEARNIAQNADDQAASALESERNARNRNELLMLGGGVIVALLVVGGGVYWYLNSRQTHDKLG